MNDKTTKLIRKYAGRTGEDKKALKRRWNAMAQDERSSFRRRMVEVLSRDDDVEEHVDSED